MREKLIAGGSKYRAVDEF